PIPINASVGMLLSLLIALIVTPWLALKLLKRHGPAGDAAHAGDGQAVGRADGHADGHAAGSMAARLQRLFQRLLGPFLEPQRGTRRRRLLFATMAALVLAAAGLAGVKLVVLKMLPFDNKSELQIVVDLPEGRSLEDTSALLAELSGVLDRTPEVLHYQAYAGTAAPINFNGLVRQYYLREGANVGDLQVNLVDRHDRKRESHDIAVALRPQLADIGRRHGASVKVVEVPPGPPVLSPIVAEIYGPDYDRARALGRELEQRFLATEGIVDVDTSVEAADARRQVLQIDRERAARLGVSQADIAQSLASGLAGLDASHLVDGSSKYPRPIRLRLPAADQASLDGLLALRVRGGQGQLVPLSELVQVRDEPWDGAIHHKDLLPVVYVMGDESGTVDSPLYGMFDLVGQVADTILGGLAISLIFGRLASTVLTLVVIPLLYYSLLSIRSRKHKHTPEESFA
ncbi:MAG: efflux RND transporter permease subunit, partial [Ottowia sp.]